MSGSVAHVLEYLRAEACSESAKSARIERQAKRCFEVDPLYTDQFSRGCLWSNIRQNRLGIGSCEAPGESMTLVVF